MSEKKNKKRKHTVKYGRVLGAMLGIVAVMFGTDAFWRAFFVDRNGGSYVVEGRFKTEDSTISTTIGENDPHNPDKGSEYAGKFGYSTKQMSSEAVCRGELAIYTPEMPADVDNTKEIVRLTEYTNDCYSVYDDNVLLNADAAEALNELMEAYNSATGLNDFVVYGTTNTYTGSGSFCPKAFPDSASGNAVDLALLGYGTLLTYDGCDEEGWIVENCDRYGFIVRYPKGKTDKTGEEYCPWHLTYVGEVHARAMKSRGYCLEEYVELIKNYDVDNQLSCTIENKKYHMYFVRKTNDSTAVPVPVNGMRSVSGDNSEGFIVTISN